MSAYQESPVAPLFCERRNPTNLHTRLALKLLQRAVRCGSRYPASRRDQSGASHVYAIPRLETTGHFVGRVSHQRLTSRMHHPFQHLRLGLGVSHASRRRTRHVNGKIKWQNHRERVHRGSGTGRTVRNAVTRGVSPACQCRSESLEQVVPQSKPLPQKFTTQYENCMDHSFPVDLAALDRARR